VSCPHHSSSVDHLKLGYYYQSVILIAHSDHVFFFSYTQPDQKGGVLGMWSDADALAKINGSSSRSE
jgi:hypothetical protein